MKKSKKYNNEINIWKLIPNQYEFDIYLCLSNKSIKQLIPIFNQKYGLDFDLKLMEEITKNQNNDCTLFNDQKKVIIISLKDYNQTADDYATLSHQIFHVITFISESLNIPIDHQTTTQVWAYFMSFYMTVCIQILNEFHNSTH